MWTVAIMAKQLNGFVIFVVFRLRPFSSQGLGGEKSVEYSPGATFS